MTYSSWFLSGWRLKRRLAMLFLGFILTGVGVSVLMQSPIFGLIENKFRELTGALFGAYGSLVGGTALIVLGAVVVVQSFRPLRNVYQRHSPKRGPRVVVIGGGTGLSVLLRGLKEHTENITAIVSVTDDGGSSGRLRGQFGILPPGDLRNCLVALADTEPAMEKLFNYRFSQGNELEGHNLGNLLITALADLSGSFETAINEISKVLAVRGRVLPSTLDNIVLAAELEDESIVMGESVIAGIHKPIKRVFTIPASSRPVPEALAAIQEADAIILGPGSLYTSVIPNLLVPGFTEAIRKAPGIKVYVCNIMTQPGETIGYSASDHLKALYRHSEPGLVQYIAVNTQEIPEYYRVKYALEGAGAVEVDRDKLSRMHVQVLSAPMIEEGDYIRHDPQKLAALLIRLVLAKRDPKLFVQQFKRN